MNLFRVLKGTLSVHYKPWSSWRDFGLTRYWSGRLFYFNLGKISIILDCRLCWWQDMATSKPL